MNATTYAQAVKWKWILENKEYWFQCVALVKDAVKNVWGETLGSFWGSAKIWWANKNNTFPEHSWDRIENNPSDKYQIPIVWDIIFINTNPKYEHTAMVIYADEHKIRVIEQNTGNWDGKWDDDKARINEYDYSKVRWWYHYQMNIQSYRGIPVVYTDLFVSRKWNTWKYLRNFNKIIITSLFYTLDRKRQQAILLHESWHHVYYTMPKAYREVWKLISNKDPIIDKALAKKGIVYKENWYVTNYAKTNESEDFSECLEEDFMGRTFTWYTRLKVKAAKRIFSKFTQDI